MGRSEAGRQVKRDARNRYESSPARQAYLATNREARLGYSRAHYEANADRRRAQNAAAHLLRTFGLTIEQYEAMLATQGGVCAACGRPERWLFHGKIRRLAVDHDHKTDAVRGLLCADCNTALGRLGDDPARLRALLAYLEGALS